MSRVLWPTMSRRQGIRNWSAFFFGLCAPFGVFGPELAPYIYLSPVLVAAGLYTFLSLPYFRLTRASLWLILFWLIAVVSAALRFGPDKYILSLLGLIAVSAPLMFTNLNNTGTARFFRGLTYGVAATLAIVGFDIASQTLGMGTVNDFITGFHPDHQRLGSENSHNRFLWYRRPFAFFKEPAHLGIFLAGYVFAISIYLQRSRVQEVSRKLAQLTVLFIGSLAGILLLVCAIMSLRFHYTRYLNSNLRNSYVKKLLLLILCVLPIVLIVTMVFPELIGQFQHKYFSRVEKLISVLQSGQLEGSEGSRVNAFLSLFDYWRDKGLAGFLFGTGYANHDDWLLHKYGYLGTSAALARGHVNNILVVVFLSAGVCGFMAFCGVMISLFSSFGPRMGLFPIVFVTVLCFTTGSLLSIQFWLLIFAIKIAHRQSCLALWNNDRPGLQSHPAHKGPNYRYA